MIILNLSFYKNNLINDKYINFILENLNKITLLNHLMINLNF